MASYVEQAILRIKDESSSKLRKINKELKLLQSAAKKKVNVNFTNLNKVDTQVRRLTADINRLNRTRLKLNLSAGTAQNLNKVGRELTKISTKTHKIKLNYSSVTSADRAVTKLGLKLAALRGSVGGLGGLGGGWNYGGRNYNGERGFKGGAQSGYAPFQLGRDLVRGITSSVINEAYMAGRKAVGAAVVAPINRDTQIARANAAFSDPREAASLIETAAKVAATTSGVSESTLIGAGVNAAGLISAPLYSGEGQKQLEVIMQRIADNINLMTASVDGISADQAGDMAAQFEKALAVVNQTMPGADQEMMIKAMRQAFIGTGGEVSFEEMKRVAQQLGAMGNFVGSDSFLQAILGRDESGARGTAELRSAYQDITRGNLNAEDKARMDRYGLRTGEFGNAFAANAYDAIDKFITPLLTKLKVDMTDPVAVMTALDEKLGFDKQGGISFITGYLLQQEQARAEEARARESRPEVLTKGDTVRQKLAETQAAFDDAASKMLEGTLPAVNYTLDLLNNALTTISAPDSSCLLYTSPSPRD